MKTLIGRECYVSIRLGLLSNQCVERRWASDSGPIADLGPSDFDDVPWGKSIGCSQASIILGDVAPPRRDVRDISVCMCVCGSGIPHLRCSDFLELRVQRAKMRWA